jgi:hypothetical protein
MEDTKVYSTSTDNSPFSMQFLRPRHVPDVPEDIDTDFVRAHLNDPNIDLKRPLRASIDSLELADKKSHKFYDPSEIDSESDRFSTSRAESRNSTAIDFDE